MSRAAGSELVQTRSSLIRRLLLGLGIGSMTFNAAAGDWVITPTIALNETATDNLRLSESAKHSDLVSDINPGIRIDGRGGRSFLHLDYQLHNLNYARDSTANQTQNALKAIGTVELVDNLLFVDVSGLIAQQSISAFGGTTSSEVNTNASSNSTELSTYRVSPYFRGGYRDALEYQLRYNLATTNTKANHAFDSDSREWVADLKGLTPVNYLGWSFNARNQNVDFGNGRSNEADRLRGALIYQFDPQLRALLIEGHEANNYLSVDKEGHATPGLGIEWSPTERTHLVASREERFFGWANNISFVHRTSGTAWKYNESKDAVVSAMQLASAGVGTFYDLLYNLYSSTIPEPAARAAFVNGILLNNGMSPDAQLQGGSLSTGIALLRRREMSFALVGVRNTLTFAATDSQSQDLSAQAGASLLPGEDFSNVRNIRQRGASINWSHKLTQESVLNGSFSALNSKGSGPLALETRQKLINVDYFVPLGTKTTASLGIRRVVVDGSTRYSENALTGTLAHQF